MRRLPFALVLGAVLLAGCGNSSGGGAAGGGGGGGGDLPNASTVIFGAAYDPATLAVSGKATTLKTGTPMVAVGRVFTPRAPADVTVQVGKGSSNFPPKAVSASNSPDSADLFAYDLTNDKLTAGTWVIQFMAGGKIVASGFLTVSP